jgi:uncharacterized protein
MRHQRLADTMTPVLIIPGLGNSVEGHWQTFLQESHPAARRVEQHDWDNPDLESWLHRLVSSVLSTPDAVLVAHSLGCVLVSHAMARFPYLPVRAALLVGPADVDSEFHTPSVLRGFAPVPIGRLPFRSMVVASANDPFMTLRRAEALATAWGSEFRNIGAAGHINIASGYGPWPTVHKLLADLTDDFADANGPELIRRVR